MTDFPNYAAEIEAQSLLRKSRRNWRIAGIVVRLLFALGLAVAAYIGFDAHPFWGAFLLVWANNVGMRK